MSGDRAPWDFGETPRPPAQSTGSGSRSSGSTGPAPDPWAAAGAAGAAIPGDPFAPAIDPMAEAQQGAIRSVHAPTVWLFAALAAAVLGLALALVAPSLIGLVFLAWALAGPIAVGLLTVFTLRDTERRASPWYGQFAWIDWFYRGVLLLALIAIVVAAIDIARWAGRL